MCVYIFLFVATFWGAHTRHPFSHSSFPSLQVPGGLATVHIF